MTAQQAILTLGTVILLICGAALLLIHRSNPLLKGLNWMGGALVVGSAATGLTLAAGPVPWLMPVANFLVLLTFVCCYYADRLLMDLDVKVTALGTALLFLQGAVTTLEWSRVFSARGATGITCSLAAAQLLVAALLLRRNATGKVRTAGQFGVGLMSALAVAYGFDAMTEVGPHAARAAWGGTFDVLTESLFVVASIGLAFAFFWRTTTRLSVDLEHMASTDPLTRVYNRRVFLSWCESEQARSQRQRTPFSLLMVDFDHFKSINDRFGHHVGDQVLCAAVERIQDSVRGIDVLCRWGGEEFCVLLPNASEEATLIVAERVRRNIRLIQSASPQFAETVPEDFQLSASLGTATWEGEEDTYFRMLERADKALYEAKRGGRNRVVRSIQARNETAPTSQQLVLEAS